MERKSYREIFTFLDLKTQTSATLIIFYLWHRHHPYCRHHRHYHRRLTIIRDDGQNHQDGNDDDGDDKVDEDVIFARSISP